MSIADRVKIEQLERRVAALEADIEAQRKEAKPVVADGVTVVETTHTNPERNTLTLGKRKSA